MTLPPQPWPTGLCQQLEPLVHRVLAPNASPFTYTGTQTYLVGGIAGLAVIDPGPDTPEHLAALEQAIAGAPVLAICCTHTHRDHSPAAAPLAARTGAAIVGCAPLALQSDEPRADAPFDSAYRPDRVLSDGETLEGPDWTLTAVATPGHTSNHLCYALEQTGALFSGDHVMGWSTTVVAPPDGDMADYMASLEKLYSREDRVFYPAHGPAVERPKQLLRGMIGHRRQRERQILKLLENAFNAAMKPLAVPSAGNAGGDEVSSSKGLTIGELVPAMYKGVGRHLWPAAGQSVKAHLLDLERRGRVARSEDRWTILI